MKEATNGDKIFETIDHITGFKDIMIKKPDGTNTTKKEDAEGNKVLKDTYDSQGNKIVEIEKADGTKIKEIISSTGEKEIEMTTANGQKTTEKKDATGKLIQASKPDKIKFLKTGSRTDYRLVDVFWEPPFDGNSEITGYDLQWDAFSTGDSSKQASFISLARPGQNQLPPF